METLGYLYLYLLEEAQASDTLRLSGLPIAPTLAFGMASAIAAGTVLSQPLAGEAHHRWSCPCYRPTYDPVSTQLSSLQVGDRGWQVADIQRQLNNWGFPLEPNNRLSVDGVFGLHTDRAVRQFQAYKGLAVDGIVGPRTRNALFTARR